MRTLRMLLLVVVSTLLLAAAPASAATESVKVERTLVGRYRAYPSPVTGCNAPLGPWACMIVRTQPAEQFVSVKVTDLHGQPVYFTIKSGGTFRGFCGATRFPVEFSSGSLEIEVGVSRWFTQTDCPVRSVKTKGTITVTLSNTRS